VNSKSKSEHIDIVERSKSYDKEHCWQYDIRLNNYEKDLEQALMSKERAGELRVSDFIFKPLTTEAEKREATEFIKRHEWLGNLSQYTTHWFAAYYHDPEQGLIGRDIMAGGVLFNLPNAFS